MAKKQHPEKQLKDSAISLLYYYSKKEVWEECFFSPGPFRNFLAALMESRRSASFYSDIAELAADHALESICQNTIEVFSEEDAQRLIDLTVEYIDAHAQECWIFISLENSSLTETIEFAGGNIVLISGSQDDKQRFIEKISSVNSGEASERIKQIDERKAPKFFHSPLIGIKVKHQFDYVFHQAEVYSLWSLAILHALDWSYVHPDYPLPFPQSLEKFKSRQQGSKRQDRCIIWGDRDYGHLPLGLNTECNLNLDWLQEKQYQDMFANLLVEVVEKRDKDKLNFRFFKGFRYFLKAIRSERNKDPFDGVELTILYYTIIAEGLLLKSGGKQKLRLKFLLPRLSDISGTVLSEREKVVDKAYKRRCHFVHEGEETYKEWSDDLSKEKEKDIELLKRMIAKLLCDAPQYMAKMCEQAKGQETDSAWFKYLREIYDSEHPEEGSVEPQGSTS